MNSTSNHQRRQRASSARDLSHQIAAAIYETLETALIVTGSLGMDRKPDVERAPAKTRPPFNAEYMLYLFLRREEREAMMGDLMEDYANLVERFDKRHADVWFYKQVGGSLWPLFRRALFRIGGLVWLGQLLRRLIS